MILLLMYQIREAKEIGSNELEFMPTVTKSNFILYNFYIHLVRLHLNTSGTQFSIGTFLCFAHRVLPRSVMH
jgi:hypothetical protein